MILRVASLMIGTFAIGATLVLSCSGTPGEPEPTTASLGTCSFVLPPTPAGALESGRTM